MPTPKGLGIADDVDVATDGLHGHIKDFSKRTHRNRPSFVYELHDLTAPVSLLR